MRNLDSHPPLELLIVCQVDQAKASLAQHPLHTIAADLWRRSSDRW